MPLGSTLVARDAIAWIERSAAERELIAFAEGLGLDKDGDLDLEEGAFLLARTAYPGLEDARYRRRLDAAAGKLAPEVRGESDPRRVAEALAAVAGRELGLLGNTRDYENPGNSFVNRVLAGVATALVVYAVIHLMVRGFKRDRR